MTTASISLTSGMRQNLYNLRSNTQSTETTSRRLSTGLKVENALDNPINFFMAQEHRQRASDFMARKDEMGEAIQTVKAASVGIESATALLMSAKSTAQAALVTSDSDEREALADQFNNFRSQLDNLVEDSGYKGLNLLEDGSELTVKFNENGTSNITIDGFDASASGLGVDEIGGETTETGDMNFIGDDATVTWYLNSNIALENSISEIEDGDNDAVLQSNIKIDVDATKITITQTHYPGITFSSLSTIIKISGLNDQDGHTGTKIVSIGGAWDDPNLTLDNYTVTDTSVEIDFTNVRGEGGETIIINLGYDMTSGSAGWTENSDIQTSIDEVDTAINTLRSQAKNLSNDLGTITTRQKFTSGLINTLNDGADNLTLADINLEGANMLMLQTRQSLSTTSLSLSSQASSSVLRLF